MGTFAAITLPSLLLPFSGLVVGAFRALLWGVAFSPPLSDLTGPRVLAGLLVLGLLLFEGEAYVLAMLAAYLQGRALLAPRFVEAISHWQGHRRGIGIALKIYALVILMLIAAALYESLVGILLLTRIVRAEPASGAARRASGHFARTKKLAILGRRALPFGKSRNPFDAWRPHRSLRASCFRPRGGIVVVLDGAAQAPVLRRAPQPGGEAPNPGKPAREASHLNLE